MRIVVHGVGAVGGLLAAALARAGHAVQGIARGPQLEALRTGPLRLAAPAGETEAHLPVAPDPGAIRFHADDVILMTVKSQDTAAALDALRAAGVTDQPIFCVQNGVANERMALRRFPNVHGVTVMTPAALTGPGRVAVFAAPRHAIFELGRYPHGQDGHDAALAAALEAAGIAAFPCDDVMAGKHGKLLMNLSNIVEAALGPGVARGDLPARLRAEGEDVLRAAGIAWRDVGMDDPRRALLMRRAEVAGSPRQGGSTTQSLRRGAGSLETDWLNGEIALLGRLHGRPAPRNAAACALAARLVAEGAAPGAMSLAELEAALAG